MTYTIALLKIVYFCLYCFDESSKLGLVKPLGIDNSGGSAICVIGRILETIGFIITCDISKDWAFFSLSIDIDNVISNHISEKM